MKYATYKVPKWLQGILGAEIERADHELEKYVARYDNGILAMECWGSWFELDDQTLKAPDSNEVYLKTFEGRKGPFLAVAKDELVYVFDGTAETVRKQLALLPLRDGPKYQAILDQREKDGTGPR